MLFASVLFVVDGILDGAYPGGSAWFTGKYGNLAEISYLFAIVNTAVAVMVARGSERSLQSRIGLSVFFLIERPLTAFVLGAKPVESVVTHLATAAVELFILVTALRVWQLGHSLAPTDVEVLFALEGSAPAAAPIETREGDRRPSSALVLKDAWLIGAIALALVVVLVANGLYDGYRPGGREWTTTVDGSGWLAYLFAAVIATVAARAVHGGAIPLRALIAVAVLLFIERSFGPFFLRGQDPISLALHGFAAFASLALALATAGAIRNARALDRSTVSTLEAA
jgi:hypothetical protein